MEIKELLLNKILNRRAVLGVVGLGYVGLPLAVEKAKAGFEVIGFDIQDSKVDALNAGHNYIGDVVDEDLSALVTSGKLSASSDFKRVASADIITLCVPTPLDEHDEPDLSYVLSSAASVGKYLTQGSVAILESTTYPGTTEGILKQTLEEASGLICGTDFYLGFSPERVDPGNKHYNTHNTPKVVGAIGEDALEVIATLYEQIIDGEVVRVSSPQVAEMEKLLENTYRNINIALVNEVAKLCNRMGIDSWEVIDAAKTKPYGFQAFYPSSGVGGHCIPLDPKYLEYRAKDFDFDTTMISSAFAINRSMPAYCIKRFEDALSSRNIKLDGAKTLVLGVAYKPDVDDSRESPAKELITLLESRGAQVSYFDPYISEFALSPERKIFSLKSFDECISLAFDACFINTAHSGLDYPTLISKLPYTFDASGISRRLNLDAGMQKKVERL